MKYDKIMGGKIKLLRDDKGLSLREVGKLIDMDFSYLGRIEKGFVPSVKVLREIADFYNVDLSYIVGNEMEIPDQMKTRIKKWYSLIEDSEERGYTPEDILKILDTLDSISGKTSQNGDK